MEILLDTNFIITCVKQKIDFVEITDKITTQPIKWILPEDVLKEIEKIKSGIGIKISDKSAATLSLQILQNLKPKIVNLYGKNPNIDIKIVNYILGKPIVLATLDKKLKSRVKNRILTIRGKKGLEFK